MPETDVGDLKDVFEAINKMCENMAPNFEANIDSFDSIETPTTEISSIAEVMHIESVARMPAEEVPPIASVTREHDYFSDIRSKYLDGAWAENVQEPQSNSQNNANSSTVLQETITFKDIHVKTEVIEKFEYKHREVIIIEDTVVRENVEQTQLKVDSVHIDLGKKIDASEKWSDCGSMVSLPGQVEEATSEMYYTASSEVSLTSDIEPADKTDENLLRDNSIQSQDVAIFSRDSSLTASDIRSERDCVQSGHVAAMRERFENMTRENTPCSDLRSMSPALDRASPDI